jgi:hypothetical protein
MKFDFHSRQRRCDKGRGRRAVLTTVALLAGIASAQSSAAAEFRLQGSGTFKPPPPDRMARVPAEFPFSTADLGSGTWSFDATFNDAIPDSDPDPYVGRYAGAVRSFRLTVGATSVELPVDHSEIVVSDGGLGFPERESLRLLVQARTPYGLLQVSWTQIHQTSSRMDLRGTPGLLASDALPSASVLANLPTDRRFDKFLLLRVDSPGQAQPVVYISASDLGVAAAPLASR